LTSKYASSFSVALAEQLCPKKEGLTILKKDVYYFFLIFSTAAAIMAIIAIATAA